MHARRGPSFTCGFPPIAAVHVEPVAGGRLELLRDFLHQQHLGKARAPADADLRDVAVRILVLRAALDTHDPLACHVLPGTRSRLTARWWVRINSTRVRSGRGW